MVALEESQEMLDLRWINRFKLGFIPYEGRMRFFYPFVREVSPIEATPFFASLFRVSHGIREKFSTPAAQGDLQSIAMLELKELASNIGKSSIPSS
jgi:hypothetical protein